MTRKWPKWNISNSHHYGQLPLSNDLINITAILVLLNKLDIVGWKMVFFPSTSLVITIEIKNTIELLMLYSAFDAISANKKNFTDAYYWKCVWSKREMTINRQQRLLYIKGDMAAVVQKHWRRSCHAHFLPCIHTIWDLLNSTLCPT